MSTDFALFSLKRTLNKVYIYKLIPIIQRIGFINLI